MNGLVLKDLMQIRSGFVPMGLFTAVMCLLLIDSGDMTMLVIGPVMFSTLASASFSYDDQCGWNTFAASVGISRRRIVRSKYVSAIVPIMLGAVIGVLVCIIKTADSMDMTDLVCSLISGIAMGATVSAVMICVNFVTGSSIKAQYTAVIITMIVVISSIILTAVMDEIFDGAVAMASLSAISMAAIVCSYLASCYRFEHRDL